MIQPAPDRPSTDERDIQENKNLLDTLENILLPMYYTKQENWIAMIKTAANDIVPEFEAGRLADEYYEKMYMA